MEIRHSPYPLPAPAQTQRPTPPAATQPQATGGQGRSTEYVRQGELLEGEGGSDYRDLLREARRQQVPANAQRDSPTSDHNAQAQRALNAYQDNSTTPPAKQRHIDDFI